MGHINLIIVQTEALRGGIVVNMILSFILFGKKDKLSHLYHIPMWIFDCVIGMKRQAPQVRLLFIPIIQSTQAG